MADFDYSNLPPMYGAIMRLMEDDVTPANVEQHIADYRAKLADLFPPSALRATETYRENFLEAVRQFAAYDLEGRGDA
jgi:hypothetical protein